MAGYKETPRQKMIAMLYLVLTALLALNVSKELLEAFITVNDTMVNTKETFEYKLGSTYANFEKQLTFNKEKTKPYYDKAKEVQQLSNDMKAYINNVKAEVIAETEGISKEEAKSKKLIELERKDNYDDPTRYFIGETEDGKSGEGEKLKQKIEQFKKDLLTYIPEEDRANVTLGMDTEGPFKSPTGKEQSWSIHNFYHTILAADVTLLNKMVNDVQNAEMEVVSYLYNKVDAEDFKFSEVQARVIPNSTHVFVGDAFEADVFVAAYDNTAPITLRMGGSTIKGEDGLAKIRLPASSVGLKNYKGTVELKVPGTNQIKSYEFSGEYIVAKPSLTVSATKMNVFYIGVDNPVSISVPGVPKSSIRPSISKGNLVPSGDNYIVRLGSGDRGKVNISVSADFNGASKNMGSAEFRVKSIPSPTPTIANVSSGPISKAAMLAAGAIIPQMPEDFDFDYHFVIRSFDFVSIKSGDIHPETGNGNQLSPTMRSAIESARKGDKIWFENIVAKGPEGNRKLPPIVVTIK